METCRAAVKSTTPATISTTWHCRSAPACSPGWPNGNCPADPRPPRCARHPLPYGGRGANPLRSRWVRVGSLRRRGDRALVVHDLAHLRTLRLAQSGGVDTEVVAGLHAAL